jgi:hypothetical protein
VATRDQTAGFDGSADMPAEVLGTLARLLREMRYGSIEIVVHEGRVTHIERRERVRIAPAARET